MHIKTVKYSTIEGKEIKMMDKRLTKCEIIHLVNQQLRLNP